MINQNNFGPMSVNYDNARKGYDYGKDFEDFEAGKYSLPLIMTLNNPSCDEEWQVVQSMFGKKTSPEERDKIKFVLDKTGSFMYGQMKANILCNKAKEMLSAFPESKAKDLIEFGMTMTQVNKYFTNLKSIKI